MGCVRSWSELKEGIDESDPAFSDGETAFFGVGIENLDADDAVSILDDLSAVFARLADCGYPINFGDYGADHEVGVVCWGVGEDAPDGHSLGAGEAIEADSDAEDEGFESGGVDGFAGDGDGATEQRERGGSKDGVGVRSDEEGEEGGG